MELGVIRAEEDVTLVLKQPVDAGVHELVVLEAGQVEAGERRPGHRINIADRKRHERCRWYGCVLGTSRPETGLQSRYQAAGHHVRGGSRPGERHGAVRKGFRLDRGNQHVLRPRGLQGWPLQPLHVDIQSSLGEGYGECLGGYALQPREQT